MYALFEALGYNLIFIILVVVARKRKNPWLLYFIGLGIQLFSYVGKFAEANLRGEGVSIIHMIITLIVAVVGAVVCSKAKKAQK